MSSEAEGAEAKRLHPGTLPVLMDVPCVIGPQVPIACEVRRRRLYATLIR